MTDNLYPFVAGGSLLDTEHGLVMLILLYGILTFREKSYGRWVPLVVLGGILLSLVTPVHQIELFWPVITALIVPPFLWQAAVAVTKSGPLRKNWSLVLWGVTLLLVSTSLRVVGKMPVSTSLLLGILAVTLVWYFRELKVERSYLSTIGFITIVVLLVEIDLALVSIQMWLGTLLSGASIGIVLGFLGIFTYRKLNQVRNRNVFFFVWAYLAYVAGLVFGTSAIAATLAAALVVSTYGFSIGLWYQRKDIPVPSKSPFFFYLSTVIWLTLGWQAHTTINSASLSGIMAAIVIITISVFVVRRVMPISQENRWVSLLRKETGVFLLLFGGALFWPQEAFLTTISVEIALGAAILLIFVLRFSIQPIFEIIGVELSWPEKD
jgi:hypothetical protein